MTHHCDVTRHTDAVVSVWMQPFDGWMLSAARDGRISMWLAHYDGSDVVAGFESVWTYGGNRYFISTSRMTRSTFISDGADNVVRVAEFRNTGGGTSGRGGGASGRGGRA